MPLADYEMAEQTSKLVYEYLQKNESVPKDVFQNLQVSLIYLMLSGEKFGPNVEMLFHYLYAAYEYDDAYKLDGFAIGAVYGATQFYKEFQEIKEDRSGLVKDN